MKGTLTRMKIPEDYEERLRFADRIFKENIGLTDKVVKSYQRRNAGRMDIESWEDLRRTAEVALWKAVISPDYDPKRSMFSTYACAAIWKALFTNGVNTRGIHKPAGKLNDPSTPIAINISDEDGRYFDSRPESDTPYHCKINPSEEETTTRLSLWSLIEHLDEKDRYFLQLVFIDNDGRITKDMLRQLGMGPRKANKEKARILEKIRSIAKSLGITENQL